jgi:hypothetical protein
VAGALTFSALGGIILVIWCDFSRKKFPAISGESPGFGIVFVVAARDAPTVPCGSCR